MKRTRFWLAVALLLTFLGSVNLPAATVQAAPETSATVDPQLMAALATATVPVEVIVTFHGDGAPSTADVALLRSLGITAGVTLQSLPMAGVLASASQVHALAARPEVRSLYLNRRLAYENAGATAMTGVDRLRTDAVLTSLNGGLPVSGKGVTVLVNDSGIDGTHPDLKFGPHLVQNVAGNVNLHALSDLLPVTYLENVPNTDSTGGHGTHVAGIVGATGAQSGGKYEGVAPGASLIGYGSGAALFILDTLGGFDYALTHQFEYGIRVITNSWGDTGDMGSAFDLNHPVNVATKQASDRNMVVVFSAGNSGPGEGTISGNYKKAPWVVTVAAGDKHGRLADFSSRGVRGGGGTATVDGQSWTWVDAPTVTAPGVAIISTRVVAPVSSLGAADDAVLIEPAYLPWYTTMSGTSMAAPHVAGIVALMLDANPALTPAQVKQILQQTAANMPGHEAWEVGAGYVNAYAAVDRAFRERPYGQTLNIARTFHAGARFSATVQPVSLTYSPTGPSPKLPFTVPAGTAEVVAKANALGLLGQTGNTINLVLTAPDGTTYSSGVSVLFALYPDRTVSVPNPVPGAWTMELKGILTGGVAAPETVNGSLTLRQDQGYSGLSDIAGHPAETAIKLAVSRRLVDGRSDRSFKPDEPLTRRDLADFLTMGAGIRQSWPTDGVLPVTDVKVEDLPFVLAVTARGAALRDTAQSARGVMLPAGAGAFAPNQAVRRADLAYAMVQSLGLEAEALARSGGAVTVAYGESRIPVDDAADVPAELRGYVQLSLDLNILNATFTTTQGPYDLQPVIHAAFRPLQKVTRADYAVAITRFYAAYLAE